MKFLARDEANLLEKKLRREIAEHAGPRSVLYYESGSRDYAAAANAIALSIGSFSEATLVSCTALAATGGTTLRRREKAGGGTENGAPRIMRIVDCMKLLAIVSNRTRSNSYPRQSNFPLNLAGTLWSQQSPDDSSSSSRTTIGW